MSNTPRIYDLFKRASKIIVTQETHHHHTHVSWEEAIAAPALKPERPPARHDETDAQEAENSQTDQQASRGPVTVHGACRNHTAKLEELHCRKQRNSRSFTVARSTHLRLHHTTCWRRHASDKQPLASLNYLARLKH